ncbi:Fur family transcriptional regulator [Thermodesulfobacteriota bacterium]
MSGELELFRSYITKKGLRNTPERAEIISEIFSDHDHFDVDELYLRLRQKGSKISKASIYRNIPLIMECGLIKEVWLENGHMHYEHIYGHGHHCHLRCIRCGMVIEFVEKALEEVERRISEENDFQIIEHRLDIIGYCADCKKVIEP